MNRFYTCDEAYERKGAEHCCIFSGAELEAMHQPDDGELRCLKHGMLIGQGAYFRACDHDDARRRLLAAMP